ncbi:MAG: FAD-binding oxidoreductase [Pseudomonadota bacterium]
MKADAVICGAGIAGLAAAYYLSRHPAFSHVVVVDPRPPLTLTSDKSTECYRNWWPGPGPEMFQFIERSIDLLEALAAESNNRFNMNRRGYLFASADPNGPEWFINEARAREALGLTPVRIHDGARGVEFPAYEPVGLTDALGVDVVIDRSTLRERYPYLPEHTTSVLHARRGGWLSAQQLGMLFLDELRAAGGSLIRGSVCSIETGGGDVAGVWIETDDEDVRIDTPHFINAAGPMVGEVCALLDCRLPVHCESHVKIAFADRLGAVHREAPLLIWTDPVDLGWTHDERNVLKADPHTAHLTDTFPAGVHGRPEGAGEQVLLYWTYHAEPSDVVFPLEWDPHYPEIVIRGMSAIAPGLRDYFSDLPRPYVDGGYYTKTEENRPLIGPLPTRGAFVTGAYSGFGIMAACAGGELLAAHVTDAPLPSYERAFRLERYNDPSYRALLSDWPDSGQL